MSTQLIFFFFNYRFSLEGGCIKTGYTEELELALKAEVRTRASLMTPQVNGNFLPEVL